MRRRARSAQIPPAPLFPVLRSILEMWRPRARLQDRAARLRRLQRRAILEAQTSRGRAMCRNIKTLHNFKPPATDDEVRASALQFVRKLSGTARPSKANEAAFNRAVEAVTHAAHHLLEDLVSHAPPRDRAVEAEKVRARNAERFGKASP
jgi:hypothetical protein